MKKLIKTGFMPYDSELTPFAKKNRLSQTEAEKMLWIIILRSRRLNGYKFTRQKPIYKYVLDFYCSKLSLGIEVDGGSHEEKELYDQRRTYLLNGLGIDILRFSNEEVIKDIVSVRKRLLEYIQKNQKAYFSPEKGRCPERA